MIAAYLERKIKDLAGKNAPELIAAVEQFIAERKRTLIYNGALSILKNSSPLSVEAAVHLATSLYDEVDKSLKRDAEAASA